MSKLNKGKVFEIFIREIMNAIGFSNVLSDGIYVFDGAPGQMIQGLAEAHNADVLVEPPIQIPFSFPTRLLIECKNLNQKIGLSVLRSLLGLKIEVNNFDIVDLNELQNRMNNLTRGIVYLYNRYFYQVAAISAKGFTKQAQKFALTHRITLIDFANYDFIKPVLDLINSFSYDSNEDEAKDFENQILDLAFHLASNLAVGVLESGQLLFLYKENNEGPFTFEDYFSVHWETPEGLWSLKTGNKIYKFNLPSLVRDNWLNLSTKETLAGNAINLKERNFSKIIVYYNDNSKTHIKVISIDKGNLVEAKNKLHLK